MNRPTRLRWSAPSLVAILAAVCIGCQAAPKPSGLSAPYPYMVGDAVAERMSGLFRVVAGLEAATLVTYDRTNERVVVTIVGSAVDVEGAKREIDAFVHAFQAYVVDYAKKQHDLTLTDKDVMLVYYSDTGEEPPYEVVRLEGGQYHVPAPANGISE